MAKSPLSPLERYNRQVRRSITIPLSIGFILVALSATLLIQGYNGMEVYKNSPKTDTCYECPTSTSHECSGPYRPYPCNQAYENAESLVTTGWFVLLFAGMSLTIGFLAVFTFRSWKKKV